MHTCTDEYIDILIWLTYLNKKEYYFLLKIIFYYFIFLLDKSGREMPNIEVPFTYLIKCQIKSSNTFFKSDSLVLTKWAISTASKIVGYRGQRTKKTQPGRKHRQMRWKVIGRWSGAKPTQFGGSVEPTSWWPQLYHHSSSSSYIATQN